MLKHLYIKDYVIIDEISIDFSTGMSAFTGETGAGKSILIDAIGLLCGDRPSHNVVNEGKDKALIEAILTIDDPNTVDMLASYGFDEAEEYVLTREINKDGRSSMRLNYRTITQALAKELTTHLIDIHNQHETQYLLNAKSHLKLLDRFSKDTELLKQVGASYHAYAEKKRLLDEAIKSEYNPDDVEYLSFQKQEIENSGTYENEYEELEEKQRRMMSFEKTSTALSSALESLNGTDGSLERLYAAMKLLTDLADTAISKDVQALSDNYYELLDVTEALKAYADQLSFDENELNETQNRLFELSKLRRKYGGSYQSMMERYDEIIMKLERIENRQVYLEKTEQELSAALKQYEKEASLLSKLRQEKAQELIGRITVQLNDLELPHARFDVQFLTKAPSVDGSDEVQFLISTNLGQPLSPLNKIASGGELSRIMLGLKTIFNALQGIPTVIFDEIDTGVSGSVASSIGVKMHTLSNFAQVFAVTHLGQVAACADQHYYVSKRSDGLRTVSEIEQLDQEGRIRELAKIATGTVSETALLSAKELLERLQKRCKTEN